MFKLVSLLKVDSSRPTFCPGEGIVCACVCIYCVLPVRSVHKPTHAVAWLRHGTGTVTDTWKCVWCIEMGFYSVTAIFDNQSASFTLIYGKSMYAASETWPAWEAQHGLIKGRRLISKQTWQLETVAMGQHTSHCSRAWGYLDSLQSTADRCWC